MGRERVEKLIQRLTLLVPSQTHLRVRATVRLRLVDQRGLDIVQVPFGGHVSLLLPLPLIFKRDQFIVRSQVVAVRPVKLRHVWTSAGS